MTQKPKRITISDEQPEYKPENNNPDNNVSNNI
jgi:hypothetical protein